MKKKVRSKLFNGEKLSFLPEGVLHNIMSRLPIKSLKRFECAGKSLCNLIRSNLFIEDHINQMTQNGKLLLTVHYLQGNHTLSFHGLDSANLEKVQPDVSIPFPESVIEDAEENLILGPCNGCLCIIGGERKQVDVEYDDERDAREHIVIFDLTSQNFDNLPLCRISCPPCCSDSLCGAGFGISSSGTIKIVLIREIDDEDKPYLLVNVYDSSTHSWDESQPRGFPCPSTVGGLFLNGACHWDMYNNTYSSILHFDIEKECFKKMKYPDVLMKTYFNERKFLTILNGCLTVIRHKLEATPAYDIWVMKEYNRNSSWSKQFVLKPGFVISPLCWMHNGCLLVRDYGEKKLRCIEPLTSGAKDIQLDGGTETLQVLSY